MLWERAKNLIIIFFLCLNLLLAVLLYREQNRYTLSAERERAIVNVLDQNKMNVYSEMIHSFTPMRQMSLSGYVYDTGSLLSLFFGSEENAVPLNEQDMEVFEGGEGRLTVSNGYITFERKLPSEEDRSDEPVTPDKAMELCDAFISSNYPDYELDRLANDGILQTTEEGYLRLTYRQMFKKNFIHRNFIEFLVTGNGIEQIEMQYGADAGYTDDPPREICAPDEALLTLIQRIRTVYSDMPVMINGMDIVYNQEEFSTQEGTALQAVPFYRIFINDNYEPFLINAYTNVCIN